MNRKKAVARLAARAPKDLRGLRARLMLEPLYAVLGVEETGCPACDSSGWLDKETLACCPLCLGFREVPARLADWFNDRMRAASENPPRRGGCRGRRGVVVYPIDGQPRVPYSATAAERWGRMAEEPYRVSLPVEK
jgi:hypothetical protein